MVTKDGELLIVDEDDIIDGEFNQWGGVTSIGDDAFYYIKSLVKIDIPSTVTSIGARAFYNCYNLRTINLPDSIKKIKNNAFENCEGLEYVELPENLTTISESLFNNCIKLTTIKLPSKLRKIEEAAFKNCSYLKDISFPSSLKEIGNEAFFHCYQLDFSSFPDNIEKIGSKAFLGCNFLEEIEIPSKVKEISSSAFKNCEGLEKVIIQEGVEKIHSAAFKGCTYLKEVSLPESLKYIGNSAFSSCSSLSSINIPKKIETIEFSLFENCSNLKKIILHNQIKEIGSQAFYRTGIEKIKLPNNLTAIGEIAFGSCNNLTSIEIPKKTLIVGDSAFVNCYNLKEVKLNDILEYIGSNCFKGCESLEKIKIGRETRIGDHCFEECDKLEEIEYDGEIKILDNYESLFFDNEEMKSFIIDLIIKLEDDNKIEHNLMFPGKFIKLLDKDQTKLLMKYENIRYFKDIYNNYLKNNCNHPDDLRDFYKLAYVLGCFDDEEIVVNSKKINVAQKASVFLKQVLDANLLKITECSEIFEDLTIKKYNIDFLKFVTLLDKKDVDNKTNYYNFMYLLEKKHLICRIMNNFEEVMKQVVTDEVGRVIVNPSIKKRIDTFLINNTFSDVQIGNEDIVEEFMKFHTTTQKSFDDAQEIRKKAEKTPHHILNGPLFEQNIMQTIKSLQSEIESKSVEAKQILDELYEKEFTYEWLNKHDPKNFTLGLYCDCCASIISALYGKDIMKASITRDDVQNLVIKDNNGRIVAKSTIYVNKKKGYAVFNNIELNRKYGNEAMENDQSDDEKRDKIYKAFKRGVRAFIDKYNEMHPNNPLVQVNIGWGHNKLKQIIKKYEQKSDEIFPVLDCFEDSIDEQWIVYKK